MKEPEFQKDLPGSASSRLQPTMARLQQGTSAAATTLIKLLLDPNTPASVRARVADSIFAHASRAIEIEDIEARVSDLERAAEETKAFR